MKDIKEGIWNAAGGKSPGPDGFSMNSFKARCNIIKHDLIDCINDFYFADSSS